MVVFCVVGFCAVGVRLFYMQIIQNDFYQDKAINNQTRDTVVSPKRGTIYDRNMKVLAVSASTEMVIVDPRNVEEGNAEKISRFLAELLEEDYDSVYEKVTKDSAYQIIKRRVERDVTDQIRAYISEESVKGISFSDDSKRYYPYGNFAAQVIGFTGAEGTGLYGVEARYNDVLEGTAGRIVSAKNAGGKEMTFEYEQYIAPQDGDGVVLTIDEGVQHFLEKHLETAYAEHEAAGVAGIVMNVKTGEILGMASKPDFDLNEPYTVSAEPLTAELRDSVNVLLEEHGYAAGDVSNDYLTEGKSAGLSDALTEEVRELVSGARKDTLETMWKNKTISDLYEPGSTFKLFTMASAYEEGTVNENSTFSCSGSKTVIDTRIGCWKKAGHGHQVLMQALQNSCNPALMDIGLGLGGERFLEYFKAFGMMEKTGVDLPGETNSIFHAADNFGKVDLAISSFGQSFSVTPIQMISMVSAIVDDGKLKTPHIVKEIVDSEGNVKETVEPEIIRQVISEETSDFMCKAMESVVSIGTGKKAYVAGYRVGGKTGTSEKYPRGNNKYVASFIGVAPMDDPQYAVLIMIDESVYGSVAGGGAAAAPICARVFEDILPYLGVEAEYSEEELSRRDITVPNLVGLTAEQAGEVLKSKGLSCRTVGDGDTVTDQIPANGVKVPATAELILYMGEEKPAELVTVPDVKGCSMKEANRIMTEAGLYMKVTGVATTSGAATVVDSQSIAYGTKVSLGTVVTVILSNNTDLGE